VNNSFNKNERSPLVGNNGNKNARYKILFNPFSLANEIEGKGKNEKTR